MRRFCINNGGTGGSGWGHLQGNMYMVAARLGCESVIVGTKWATHRSDCMERVRKHHSHLVGGWCRGLVSGKESCLGSERVYGN